VKILIVSLPRTGSSQLLIDVSKKHQLKSIFEPYNIRILNNDRLYSSEMNDVAVKTIIGQTPKKIAYDVTCDNYVYEYLKWLYNFIKDFDEVILLSRKNLIACIESISFLMYNITNKDKDKNKNFTYNIPYYYEAPPVEIYNFYKKEITAYDKIINIISKDLNIPITYYEDIYDLNSPNRLRKDHKDKKTNLTLI